MSKYTPCRCPTMSRNPAMDTFCHTEPVCPREDTLILPRLQNQAEVSYFGSMKLAICIICFYMLLYDMVAGFVIKWAKAIVFSALPPLMLEYSKHLQKHSYFVPLCLPNSFDLSYFGPFFVSYTVDLAYPTSWLKPNKGAGRGVTGRGRAARRSRVTVSRCR